MQARSMKSLPLGLLGALTLVGGVEWSLMRHDLDLTTLVAANWGLEADTPGRRAAKADILCFGDSMVKFGVQPRVLGPALGRKVANFAMYCGTPELTYYRLRRAFDAGARPAAILVDFQPELMMCDALRVTARVVPEALDLGEIFDLGRAAGDPELLGQLVVGRLLPSARKRPEVRAAVAAAVAGRPEPIRERVLAARRNWRVNAGAEVLPKNFAYQGTIPTDGPYPSMFWTPWKPNRLSVAYFERFLSLAARHQVPVFWILQPNAPEVDARRGGSGYYDCYEYFIRGYQRSYPNLFVIDGRHVNYPPGFFVDPVHLDRDGAVACSLGIADVLRPILVEGKSPVRWQTLPDHRGRVREVALEDHIQSALANRAEAASRPSSLRR